MEQNTPIYLYIKQHTITGLKYFGSTYKNPYNYLGSGTYWKKHIKEYGKEFITTVWIKEFYNLKELQEYAVNFSKENDIVKSKDWANLIIEAGSYFKKSVIKPEDRKTKPKKWKLKTKFGTVGCGRTILRKDKITNEILEENTINVYIQEGYTHTRIYDVCKGVSLTHRGFKWEYKIEF